MEPAPATVRDIGLEEAMAIAVLFQKNGQLGEAERIYREILTVVPDHPDAVHFAGILAHQQGRSDEGIAMIERSLALDPDQADCYSNLGIIFKALGRLDEAVTAYEHAIALNPDHANAYSNLGVLYRAQGKPVESEAAYRTAIRLDPDHIDAYHNLGVLLASLKRTPEAVACYCKVTTLSPHHPSARRLMALAHCTIGQVDKAIEIFERWLEEEPDDPIPLHMLAACSGKSVPARASDAFVEKTFDSFAASFDSKLERLSYRAPAIVGALLSDSGMKASKRLDVLDAGCGTGLCGPHLAPYARRLIGVDLSAGMLTAASEKGIYDELLKGELTEYLRRHLSSFDIIVSADTLVYFGDLEDVARAASAALRPDGMLIFTVEEWADAPSSVEFSICTHGRYRHTWHYVERVLSETGLRPSITRAELRMESGVPVSGLAVGARK
jgi:predicted TPR repeat methyltransferase